jgi:hypothetical protein
MYWQAKRPQWRRAHLNPDFQTLIDHHDHQVKQRGFDLKPLCFNHFGVIEVVQFSLTIRTPPAKNKQLNCP